MAFAYLTDPEKQYMTKSGTINVDGFLKVFDAATDDPAVTYKDFSGTENPERIGLDNNGRAIVIADSDRAYRLEVYDRYGTLMWTTSPLWCIGSAGGGGTGLTDIISSDGSIEVVRTDVGSSSTFDLSVAQDSVESLDWIRTEGYTLNGSMMVPTYQDGSMEVGQYGITLRGGRYYHVTARLRASVTAMPVYNEFSVTFSGMKDGEIAENYLTRNFIADCSTELHQDYEVSFDVKTGENAELYATVTGLETGVSVGLMDIEVHRVYSGVPSIPEGTASREWVRANYQEILSGGPGIELSGNNIAVDFSDVQARLEAGAGIDITDDTVSVDFTEVQAKLEAGANIVIEGNTISATAEPQLNADWDATSGVQEILHRPDLSVYATLTDLAGKQDVLTAGANIVIENNTISATAEPQLNADWDASSGVQEILHKPDLSVYAEKSELATVATTGSYNSLEDKPSIPAAQVQTDWDAPSGMGQLLNKPDLSVYAQSADLAAVATTGSYNSLTDLPTIPAAQVQTDWDATSGMGQLLNRPDLSVYAEKSELATVATTGSYDSLEDTPDLSIYAESSSLATVASTGSYDDLLDKPTIPAAQVNADWDAPSGISAILHKPDLSVYELAANKKQSIDADSTTDFPSSKATADFVNSSVATATARFLGNFTLTDLGLSYGATNAQIATALDGYTWPVGTTPTNNDYVYVEIQNPQTTGIDDEVRRFKFNGTNWAYEYTLNNSSFTADEKAAIDSGITSSEVSTYNAHVANTDIHVTTSDKSTWNGKQDDIADLSDIRSGAAAGATAVQPGDLAAVATTGSYNSLTDTPVIPAAQVQTDWDAPSGMGQLLNKPDLSIYAQSANLSAVATTGSYNSLTDTPTIPAAQVQTDWDAPSGMGQLLNKPDLSIYAQSSSLATVATTGSYNSLTDTPTIPAAQVNADWDATSGVAAILNKPSIPEGVPSYTTAEDGKVLGVVDDQGTATLEWVTPSPGGVTDVEVNGSSVVSGGVASITIPAQVNADWDATSGVQEILNKPEETTLVAGDNITITESGSTLTISGAGGADWDATSGEPGYISNRPVPKTLVAGAGITITETANNLTVATTGLIPEAPTDGGIYARVNGAWVDIASRLNP